VAANGAPPCGIRSQGASFLAGGITMDSLARNLGGRSGGSSSIALVSKVFYELTLNYDAARDRVGGVAI
jgi:hypothetical protein